MIEAFTDEYKWLSNFYPCDIEIGRKIYPTVQHAYMSAKCNDKEKNVKIQVFRHVIEYMPTPTGLA